MNKKESKERLKELSSNLTKAAKMAEINVKEFTDTVNEFRNKITNR